MKRRMLKLWILSAVIAHACKKKKLGAVKRVERRHAIHERNGNTGDSCVEARWPLRREVACVLTVTNGAVQLCGAAAPRPRGS